MISNGSQDDHYYGVVLEDINDKMEIILEGQAAQATSLELKAVDERLTRVEEKVNLIEKAVTATNRDLHDHEKRITKLEDKVFN